MCGNYTYFAEGCGMLFRSTKGAMRLHRSGFEVYPEILRYTEVACHSPLDCVKSRSTSAPPVETGVTAACAGHVANLALRGSGVWAG